VRRDKTFWSFEPDTHRDTQLDYGVSGYTLPCSEVTVNSSQSYRAGFCASGSRRNVGSCSDKKQPSHPSTLIRYAAAFQEQLELGPWSSGENLQPGG